MHYLIILMTPYHLDDTLSIVLFPIADHIRFVALMQMERMAMKSFRQRVLFLLLILALNEIICTSFYLELHQFIRHHGAINRGALSTKIKLLQNSAIINTDDISIPIIYEDENILAICKPPHIPHHDDPQRGQFGILSLIRNQQSEQAFPYSGRLYGVHRLDRVTSGILLFAKDSSTASTLITKFQRKEVKKYYFAISGKKPKKKKQGWVKGQMVIGRRGSYKLLNDQKSNSFDDDVVCGSDGRQKYERGGYAETRFFTAGLGNLELAFKHKVNNDFENKETQQVAPKTAILFEPHTGKTHQLRVAAKSVGLPILGDARYGGGKISVVSKDIAGNLSDGQQYEASVDRTFLHASAIHFEMEKYNVTLCSSPPFGYLFQDMNDIKNVFVGMMEKHCNCGPILEVIQASSQSC